MSDDAAYVSLQYGDVSADLDAAKTSYGISIHQDLGVDVTNDIDGLAALIASLDLVTTTSNTTAHLAGALGIPTWVLVPRGPARLWYWFDGDKKCLWYPSVSLYWQVNVGDWHDPIARIAADLDAWCNARSTP